MAKQISDLIVERLIEWGVDTIFGFPGDGVDGFFESLRTHADKLKFRSEERSSDHKGRARAGERSRL